MELDKSTAIRIWERDSRISGICGSLRMAPIEHILFGDFLIEISRINVGTTRVGTSDRLMFMTRGGQLIKKWGIYHVLHYPDSVKLFKRLNEAQEFAESVAAEAKERE